MSKKFDKRKRMKAGEIINNIFLSMMKLKLCTSSELAEDTGLSKVTIENYLGLIQNIQRNPFLEVSTGKKTMVCRLIEKSDKS